MKILIHTLFRIKSKSTLLPTASDSEECEERLVGRKNIEIE